MCRLQIDAIRTKLENYAEIEEVWVVNSKRQFRRWIARLDDEKGAVKKR